jgi:hypothetical protein
MGVLNLAAAAYAMTLRDVRPRSGAIAR